jgi:adenylosuccinate lyase
MGIYMASDSKIHPIEGRYRTKAMADLFTEESKLYRWLRVEAALAKAHAALGTIPVAAAEEINKKANLTYVKLARVQEIEDKIHHDLMAMVKALSEQCENDAGNYVHLCATSYDIEDTAMGIQLAKALDVLAASVTKIFKILLSLTEKHKMLVCVGRTHGQQALPTTYGMRFGVWAAEMARHLDRIQETKTRIAVGKMSGAVGSMASFGDKGMQVQQKVMEILANEFGVPLKPVLIANQVVQRDRHAEVVNLTGLIAGTVDKIAREQRILQRNEIGEMFEPFAKDQVGSSTMPHKRNPHKAERLCSLARVIKSHLIVGIDNISLEDERDLTNSANERIILAENFVLLDFMLAQQASILDKIELNNEAIQRNLNFTHGAFLAEKVMVDLVDRGIGRQDGHEILRQAAIAARTENISMKSVLMRDTRISKLFSEAELDALLAPENYLGMIPQQLDALIAELNARYP